jgi:hypothetical protein
MKPWKGYTGSLGFFLVTLEISDHHPDGLFIGNSKYRLPPPFTMNQTASPEFLNMMRYGRKRNVKFVGHFTHR